GTLLANLVMEDDSAYLAGGVQKALSIGSALTMNTGIQMDEATLRALDDMAVGDTFWLIGAANGVPMEYEGAYGEDAWYGSMFSRTAYGSGYELEGDFNIVFDETDGFGLKKFSNTPEPTTGTLSLLALAALAARRRRK
ncbi:MAG: MYXO-CTERM sorting domain-containing protein, partial [Akkermansia sp.]|nr:MYXO-CTERM sorting domain-containing protein [Akkermansia sp.]